MHTQFNFTHTLQAAAHLLKLQKQPLMGYLRLLKLLYIADREMLAEHLSLITCDQPFAMRKGPVLSHTLALIRGRGPLQEQQQWREHLETSGYALVLTKDPGHGELSRAIRGKLEEVNRRYADMDDEDLIEETHKFQEWLNHYVQGSNSAFPFDWEAVLAAQGKQASIEAARKKEAARQAVTGFIG